MDNMMKVEAAGAAQDPRPHAAAGRYYLLGLLMLVYMSNFIEHVCACVNA